MAETGSIYTPTTRECLQLLLGVVKLPLIYGDHVNKCNDSTLTSSVHVQQIKGHDFLPHINSQNRETLHSEGYQQPLSQRLACSLLLCISPCHRKLLFFHIYITCINPPLLPSKIVLMIKNIGRNMYTADILTKYFFPMRNLEKLSILSNN